MDLANELKPTARFLMGPGPSDVHPRVLKAMATPLVGHLDPQFIEIRDGVQRMLAGRTRNDGFPGRQTRFGRATQAIRDRRRPAATARAIWRTLVTPPNRRSRRICLIFRQ